MELSHFPEYILNDSLSGLLSSYQTGHEQEYINQENEDKERLLFQKFYINKMSLTLKEIDKKLAKHGIDTSSLAKNNLIKNPHMYKR